MDPTLGMTYLGRQNDHNKGTDKYKLNKKHIDRHLSGVPLGVIITFVVKQLMESLKISKDHKGSKVEVNDYNDKVVINITKDKCTCFPEDVPETKTEKITKTLKKSKGKGKKATS